jgi:hypothetical protein
MAQVCHQDANEQNILVDDLGQVSRHINETSRARLALIRNRNTKPE